MAFVAFIGVLINFLAVGPVFATEVFKFDIKKSTRYRFERQIQNEDGHRTNKVHGEDHHSLHTNIRCDVLQLACVDTNCLHADGQLALVFHAFLVEVVVKVGIFFLIVAVMDFAYQKYNFAKEMKMEKFEVKQEYKNSEGDPLLRANADRLPRRQLTRKPDRGGAARPSPRDKPHGACHRRRI